MAIWKAKTKDGKEVSELNTKWADVADNIVDLLLITNENQIITLPKNMEKYVQAKTASAELGTNKIQLDSRYIGFKLGNNIVKIRVDERTNNISIEVD